MPGKSYPSPDMRHQWAVLPAMRAARRVETALGERWSAWRERDVRQEMPVRSNARVAGLRIASVAGLVGARCPWGGSL